MEFKYLNKKDNRDLVKDLFLLKFKKEDLPYKTIVLPLGLPALIYVFNEQTTIVKGIKKKIKGLTLFGQFYGAYDYLIDIEGTNIGINFKPTSLYKILNRDISLFTNKHILLNEINSELKEKIEPIFIKNKDNIPQFKKEIIQLIDNLSLNINDDVSDIDKAIDLIFEKEGLIQVNDLLEIVPFSQKSLELKFKKIIGLTPGKFIKMIRFNTLMIKYHSKEIDLKDLIQMYNYYDHSHFTKDFKFFIKQSPKDFFNKDYQLIKKYLKE